MEVHRQHCQNCGGMDVRNILVREPGERARVYVRCAVCGNLVARYDLSDYYHHGKGLESYLRSHGVSAADSGREWLAKFQQTQEEASAGYEAALKQLFEEQKDI